MCLGSPAWRAAGGAGSVQPRRCRCLRVRAEVPVLGNQFKTCVLMAALSGLMLLAGPALGGGPGLRIAVFGSLRVIAAADFLSGRISPPSTRSLPGIQVE